MTDISDKTMIALHDASKRRSSEVTEEFPPTWDPNTPGHPNPITMVAFPVLQKPPNASSYLIEATHIDGKRYTLWLSDSLLKSLIRADVAEGSPVSIHRSLEKRPYHNEALGREVQAWQWTVTTPRNQDAPVRGGTVASMADVRAQLTAPERVKDAAPEIEPPKTALEEALEGDIVDEDDRSGDVPF